MENFLAYLYVAGLILWFPLLICAVLYVIARTVPLSRKRTTIFMVIGFALAVAADYLMRDYHSWAVFIAFLCCYKGVIL